MRSSPTTWAAAAGLTMATLLAPAAIQAQDAAPAGGPQEGPPPAEQTELVFEREVFQYPSFTRRNPFIPLDTEASGPRFDQLSLIGVMYSATAPATSVAVLSTGGVTFAEDGTMSAVEGEAYYLKVGQRLGNVTVVEIQPERVVVDVEEFGLTDRRTLEIQSRRGGN